MRGVPAEGGSEAYLRVRRSAAPILRMGTRRANAADGPFSAAC